VNDDADKAVLRDLARIAWREGLRFFVIGAGARFLVHDWPHAITGGRGTTDWDIAVRVATWTEYEQLRSVLTRLDAPFRPTMSEHKFVHVQGRQLDVVPFGGVETEDRTVVYPTSGSTLSVLGFRECEEHCVPVDVGDGLRVNAVGSTGLVLLKAQTYLDRRPALTYDIQDIDFIVRTYGETLGDRSVFERASDVLQEERVAYEHVGAYLLGRDIAEIGFGNAAVAPLRTLLAELSDPKSRAADDVQVSKGRGLEPDRTTILLRYEAFRLGLGP
jgi:predicted nucleotidyltransferase